LDIGSGHIISSTDDSRKWNLQLPRCAAGVDNQVLIVGPRTQMPNKHKMRCGDWKRAPLQVDG
jgi:hypothetical protein